MPILILGGEDDEHARHVFHFLKRIGRDAAILDSRQFPQSLRVAWSPTSGAGRITSDDGRTIALDEVTAIYWRNYFGVLAPQLPDAEQSYIAHNDSRGLFESLLIQLPVRWVNSWTAYQSHQTK